MENKYFLVILQFCFLLTYGFRLGVYGCGVNVFLFLDFWWKRDIFCGFTV